MERDRLALWVREMCIEAEISIQGGRLMGHREGKARSEDLVKVSWWSRFM